MIRQNIKGNIVLIGLTHKLYSRADALSNIMSSKLGFYKIFMHVPHRLPPLLQLIVANVYVLVKLLWIMMKYKSKIIILIDFSYMLTPVAFTLKKLGFIKYLIYDDADYAPIFSKNIVSKALVGFLEILGIRTADMVISASEVLKRFRSSIVGEKKVYVVPNGIDNIFCKVHYRNRPFDIAYLGHIDDSYIHFTNMLEALTNLCKEKSIKVIITGSGKDSAKTHHYMRKCRGIKFLGTVRREQATLLLSSSKIGIAPYRIRGHARYGDPLKIKEYLVTTLCVAVSDIMYVKYFLTKVNACYEIIDDPSPEGIAHTINKLLHKIQENYKIIWNSHLVIKDHLCTNYSWDILTVQYVKAILDLEEDSRWVV